MNTPFATQFHSGNAQAYNTIPMYSIYKRDWMFRSAAQPRPPLVRMEMFEPGSVNDCDLSFSLYVTPYIC